MAKIIAKANIDIAKAFRHSPSFFNPHTHNCLENWNTHTCTQQWRHSWVVWQRDSHVAVWSAMLFSVDSPFTSCHFSLSDSISASEYRFQVGSPALFSTGTGGAPPAANIAGWEESWWEAGRTQTTALLNEVILTAAVEPRWPRLVCPCHLFLACTPPRHSPCHWVTDFRHWFVVCFRQPRVNLSRRLAMFSQWPFNCNKVVVKGLKK